MTATLQPPRAPQAPLAPPQPQQLWSLSPRGVRTPIVVAIATAAAVLGLLVGLVAGAVGGAAWRAHEDQQQVCEAMGPLAAANQAC